jgi:hypothetical protein
MTPSTRTTRIDSCCSGWARACGCESYNFSKAKRNPYARRLKRLITIRIVAETIAYFRDWRGRLASRTRR